MILRRFVLFVMGLAWAPPVFAADSLPVVAGAAGGSASPEWSPSQLVGLHGSVPKPVALLLGALQVLIVLGAVVMSLRAPARPVEREEPDR